MIPVRMGHTLSFRYELAATYSAPVRRHNFAFSFLPVDTARQRVISLTVSAPGETRETVGAFGTPRIYGCIDAPHTDFTIALSGIVETGPELFEEDCGDPLKSGMFRAQSFCIQPGFEILVISMDTSGGLHPPGVFRVLYPVSKQIRYPSDPRIRT